VKTIKFKNPTYIGDPINAVRIFNDKEVDELVFLDITATLENRTPQMDLIHNIATECFMPFAYGGGVHSIDTASKILKMGSEKIIFNSTATDLELIGKAANRFGSQSVVVSIDVKRTRIGGIRVFTHSGTVNTGYNPTEFAKMVESAGAGEIFLNSIDYDGTMKGYDIGLIKSVTSVVNIPVVACGGAGNLEHFKEAIVNGGASAVSAGSMFVFHGPHRAVLINYPTQDQLRQYLS